MRQLKLPISKFLVLSIFVCSSIILQAQKEFIGSKKSLKSKHSQDLLKKYFTDVNIYTVNSESVIDYVNSTDSDIQLRFKMGDEYDWNLNLTKRNIYSPNYLSKIGTEEGIEEIQTARPITTYGYLRDGSGTVSITFAENFIYGLITKEGKELFIEPARLFDPAAGKNSFVIYESDNVIPGHGTCGVTETIKHKPRKTFKSGKQSDCKIAEFAHAADFSMYASHSYSVAMTNSYIAGVINNVQLDYNQFEVEYQIVETYVHTTSATTNPWPTSNLTTSSISASDLLNDFRAWGNGGGFSNVFDLGQLWTDKNIDNGLPPADPNFRTSVVGLAGVGTTCNPGYSLIEDYSSDINSMRVTVSHELGHNFGCSHNYEFGSSCHPPPLTRPKFIMDPSVSASAMCWSNGTAVCDLNSTATMETNILSFACLEGQVDSGKDINVTACIDDNNAIDLNGFIVMENTGGSWTVNAGGLNPTSGFTSAGFFTPAGNAAGIYLFNYTVSGDDLNPVNCTAVSNNPSGHCDATTPLTVELLDLGVGVPMTPVPTICNTSSSIYNLLGELIGATTGGTWTVNGTGLTPSSGFNLGAGTFDPVGNAVGTYLFDYTKTGTLITGAAALQCTDNVTSTDGDIFGENTYGAIATLAPVGCTPDTRIDDCATFILEVDITTYNGPPNQAKISIRPPGCSLTGATSRLTSGIGTYTFTELDFAPGFDPSGGFCVIVHDNSMWIATDIDFTADLVIDYPAIPDTGCEDMMSTVEIAVSTCTPPPNDSCANAIYLQCADAITVNTTFGSIETLPNCSAGAANSNFNYTAWYRFLGTGETLQISTCNSLDDYDQEIHLYSGSCGSFTCVATDENSCAANDLPELTFSSIAGVDYFIMVGSDTPIPTGGSLTLEFNCGNCIDRNDILLSPPNDFVTGDVFKFETDQNVIADNIINAGADIIYDGKQGILMNPNFEVKLGATYLAIPDGCAGAVFTDDKIEEK